MREETKEIINNIANLKKNFISKNFLFNSEQEFQIWLGRELIKIGFGVYTDKKICEISSFKGDKEKPDLLVFFKQNFKKNKVIEIKSPFAIETKSNNKNTFNNLSKSILQIKKYYKKNYYTEKWKGNVTNIFLSTDDLILQNKIYNWYIAGNFYDDKSFHQGMYWALIRILSTISNKSGLLGWDGNNYTIETPNSTFYLLKGGYIGYKPNIWNNYGKGYRNS